MRDIKRSTDFYRRLGFELVRDADDFVELTWDDHRLYLAELSAFPEIGAIELQAPPKFPLANIRVMVPYVDDCWWRIGTTVCPTLRWSTPRRIWYPLHKYIVELGS